MGPCERMISEASCSRRKMQGVLSQRRHDESRARVDEGDRPEDGRRHCLVADRTMAASSGFSSMLRRFVETPASFEYPTEPLEERAATSPEDLDGLDPAVDGVRLQQRTRRS
jgi:hypothetical protein